MRARDPAKERAIRDRALAMIVKGGFDGLSMQKLAEAAGVSPATIYIYFRDRDDLIFRLHEEENAKMAEATLRDFDPRMPLAEGLRRQWINRARYCLDNPLSAHFIEQMRYSPLWKRCEKSTARGRFVEAMRAFVDGAIARGELSPMPVAVYWSVAFAPLYQLVKFHLAGHSLPGAGPFALDDATLDQALKLVLKALQPDRPEAR
jgi:TetR/AcrR family transcriptional repressor of multidrug resistance operon